MSIFFYLYLSTWALACFIALVLFMRDKKAFALSHADYWRFLFKGWKVGTFLIAAIGLTVIAPYSGDPTWDYYDASFMSLLTFFTAPWAVGVLYKVRIRDLSLTHGFVAFCAWMFSASWSYDLYLLIKDGYYPITWLPNIFLSSVLYCAAGLLWNLDWQEGRGLFFSFIEHNWPAPTGQPLFNTIFWFALTVIMLVGFFAVLFMRLW